MLISRNKILTEEEVEENEEKLLLYDVITHHKSHQQTGFIEIQLDME